MSFQDGTEMFMLDDTEGLSTAPGRTLSVLFLLVGAIDYHTPFLRLKRGQYEEFHAFVGVELGNEGGREGGKNNRG